MCSGRGTTGLAYEPLHQGVSCKSGLRDWQIGANPVHTKQLHAEISSLWVVSNICYIHFWPQSKIVTLCLVGLAKHLTPLDTLGVGRHHFISIRFSWHCSDDLSSHTPAKAYDLSCRYDVACKPWSWRPPSSARYGVLPTLPIQRITSLTSLFCAEVSNTQSLSPIFFLFSLFCCIVLWLHYCCIFFLACLISILLDSWSILSINDKWVLSVEGKGVSGTEAGKHCSRVSDEYFKIIVLSFYESQ